MAFEKFTGRYRVASATVPRIGLSRQATFSMNAVAFDLLGKPEHIVYLFDPDERVVGFRAAPADEPSAYKVRKQAAARSYRISGKAFCDAYSIEYGSKIRRFTPKFQDGILVFRLNEEEAESVQTDLRKTE